MVWIGVNLLRQGVGLLEVLPIPNSLYDSIVAGLPIAAWRVQAQRTFNVTGGALPPIRRLLGGTCPTYPG